MLKKYSIDKKYECVGSELSNVGVLVRPVHSTTRSPTARGPVSSLYQTCNAAGLRRPTYLHVSDRRMVFLRGRVIRSEVRSQGESPGQHTLDTNERLARPNTGPWPNYKYVYEWHYIGFWYQSLFSLSPRTKNTEIRHSMDGIPSNLDSFSLLRTKFIDKWNTAIFRC